MNTQNVNPIIRLACFGIAVAHHAVSAGQIAERRWTTADVEQLGLSRTAQWEWRRCGKLKARKAGVKVFYLADDLRAAGLIK